MSKIWVVARWEYFEKLKSKAFLFSLFFTPILILAMGILPGVFAIQADRETKAIGVIDRSGELAGTFAQRLQGNYKLPNGQPNYLVQILASGRALNLAEAVALADGKVFRGEIEGYCIISRNILADSLVEYRSQHAGDFRLTNRIEETLRLIVMERRLASLGLEPDLVGVLNVSLSVLPVKLTKSGELEESGFERIFITAYLFMMMLSFLILTSGQMLVRSVIEEKLNRIVEVLVSSCSTTELMAGKVLGLSALGFTQIGFWTLIGLLVTLQTGVTLIPLFQLLLMLVYFILGYLLYSAIFIAVGSPVTTEQEAQQVTSYLTLTLITPIVIALPAIQNPGATWLQVLTYIPLLTPTMMALRIPIQTPALWEILATVGLLLVSIVVTMILAGRIFRIAILAMGKRPRFREIIRWAKSG